MKIKEILKSVSRNVKVYFLQKFLIVISLVVVAFTMFIIALSLFAAGTINSTNAIIIFVVGILPLLAAIIAFFYYFRLFYLLTYEELYKKTVNNLDLLTNQKTNLTHYTTSHKLFEFKSLNEKIDNISKAFSGVTILNNKISYEDLNLKYNTIGEFKYIDLASFESKLKGIVEASSSYRNSVILFEYNLSEDNRLTKVELSKLDALIKKELINENAIFSFDGISKVYMYYPQIDSIKFLKERLERIAKIAIIARQQLDGVETFPLKISAVIYPYSSVENLMSDLKYASRLGNYLDVYIPNRHIDTSSGLINETDKESYISMIIEQLGNIPPVVTRESVTIIRELFDRTRDTFGYDLCGFVEYDEYETVYKCVYTSSVDSTELLKTGSIIDKKFIDALFNERDIDDEIAFTNRDKITNPELGKYFDMYNVISGVIILSIIDGKIEGIVYFLSKTKEKALDIQTRQSLSILGALFNNYYKGASEHFYLEQSQKQINDLMKITNTMMYTVSKSTFVLMYVSDTLKSIAPSIKNGQYCYKALYGLDKPCANCPLLKGARMSSKLNGKNYETSTTLSRNSSKSAEMVITPVRDKFSNKNKYDQALLINSYYSLYEQLEIAFNSGSKGYIVLVKIDNINELLETYKEEGYNLLIRYLCEDMNKLSNGVNLSYAYRNDIIAILCNEEGRSEIINRCEKFARLLKKDYLKLRKDIIIKSTVFVSSYPGTSTTVDDFIRAIETGCKKYYEFGNNSNLIIIDDGYVRPLDREEYILSLIKESIAKQTFEFRLHPMLRNQSGEFYGGEVLLRMRDETRNQIISAYEFIKVATDNGLMNAMSNIIIQNIGTFYSQYGNSVLRLNGIDRISINTDQTYFNDDTFLDKIAMLMQEYSFNDGFIAFELNEDVIYENYDLIKNTIRRMENYDVAFVVDKYSGKELSIEKLAKIGFSEVKIDMAITRDIDTNENSLSMLESIARECARNGVKLTAVGIERKEQYEKIKNNKNINFVQGYYFFKPLTTEEFIKEIEYQKPNRR